MFNFDIADFNFSSANPFAQQNIPIGGSGQVMLSLDPNGFSGFSVPTAVTSDTSRAGVTFGFPNPMPTGTSPITVNAASGVDGSTPDVVRLTGTRFGISKSITQNVQYYTGSIDFSTTGHPGDSAANPLQVFIGAPSPETAQMVLHGNFVNLSGAAVHVLGNTDINVTTLATALFNNDLFDISLTAKGSGLGVISVITVSVDVPNTSPAQTLVRQIFVVPVASPNLAIVAPVALGTSSGRNFSATPGGHPIYFGEGIDFNVTVQNTGGGPSSGNHLVSIRLGSDTAAPIVQQIYSPVIGAGQSATIPFHVVFNNVLAGTQALFATVAPDAAGEANTLDNANSISVDLMDWSIFVTSAGSASPSPLNISAGSSANATLRVNDPLNGTPLTPIRLFALTTASHLTPAGLSGVGTSLTNTTDLNSLISADSLAPNGEYAVTVVGEITDGATVTAHRQATIHITVGTGLATSVSITSDRSNVGPDGCISACPVAMQIDGPLVYTVNLTPSGAAGLLDLFFSDQGSSVVSNVDINGNQLPPAINNVAFGVPTAVTFAAAEDSSGFITSGPTSSVISAVASSPAARKYDPQDVIGSRNSRIYFNIGDIFTNTPFCTAVPSGGVTTSLTVNWQPVNGFQTDVSNITWTALGPDVVLSSGPTTVSASASYPASTFGFTNNAAAGSTQTSATFVLNATFTNSNGSATKSFPVKVLLNGTICPAFAANPGPSEIGSRGVWKRGNTGAANSTSTRRVQAAAQSTKLPDLQIRQSDVSFSPSVPKTGDTVSVRFRLSNAGDADATRVPVALQVNGRTVATEYFDVAAGKSTLAGMDWANAQLPAGTATPNVINFHRGSRMGGGIESLNEGGFSRGSALRASLVVDPNSTIKQKSTTFKSASLAQFNLGEGGLGTGEGFTKVGGAAAGFERVIIEAAEGCTGVRLSSGASAACDSTDMNILVEDIGSNKFAFTSQAGMNDLGAINAAAAQPASSSFTQRTIATAGHTYAVQLSGGKTALFTLNAIQNPRQLNAAAQKRFQKNGRKLIGRMGGEGSGVELGDVSGHDASAAVVYFDISYRIQ